MRSRETGQLGVPSLFFNHPSSLATCLLFRLHPSALVTAKRRGLLMGAMNRSSFLHIRALQFLLIISGFLYILMTKFSFLDDLGPKYPLIQNISSPIHYYLWEIKKYIKIVMSQIFISHMTNFNINFNLTCYS